jgi:hypothetical protein
MTMAYRVTIKLTKTDTNNWWFLSTDAGVVQKVALINEVGLDMINESTLTPTVAIFTRDFDDKISANRFLIKLLTLPSMVEEGEAAHPAGWTEEITTEEI